MRSRAFFNVSSRSFMAGSTVNARSLFGRPRRLGTRPGRKRIPFGPSHPALFIADPDENKGSIVPARL
jgi:hypothetical protein